MKTIHWLYTVTILLFITGVGFVVVGAKTSQHSSSLVTPIASMKEIMNGMVEPGSEAVFNAVQTTVTKQGTEEKKPKDEAEWQALTNKAALLVEAGSLMLVDGRLKDKGDWVKFTQEYITASKAALDAARARKADGVFNAGEAIDKSCDVCHMKYQK
jgi:cytochrome c556